MFISPTRFEPYQVLLLPSAVGARGIFRGARCPLQPLVASGLATGVRYLGICPWSHGGAKGAKGAKGAGETFELDTPPCYGRVQIVAALVTQLFEVVLDKHATLHYPSQLVEIGSIYADRPPLCCGPLPPRLFSRCRKRMVTI